MLEKKVFYLRGADKVTAEEAYYIITWSYEWYDPKTGKMHVFSTALEELFYNHYWDN